jgi:parallel beta-helix repeat protein
MSEARTALSTPAMMPDGTEFLTWEQPPVYSRTLNVARNHPQANDANAGTEERPFATINAAAQVVRPGQRVLIHSGVYREWVRPACGGDGPERMIHFEAAKPGEVVISASELYEGPWLPSAGWSQSRIAGGATLWMATLPRAWFDGYNPFATINMVQTMEQWESKTGNTQIMTAFLRRRGLVFQNGRRLAQVFKLADLQTRDGAYWVEPNGLVIHLRPFDDADPNIQRWELSAREHAFAPETRYLGYIRVAGFVMEHAANGFPVPQSGALSAARGHHWIVEDNTVRQSNAVGIDVGLQSWFSEKPGISGHHIIRRNTIETCGICGLAVAGAPENMLIEDNVFRGCCWQDVEGYFECAAIKCHLTRRALVRRNRILDTHGGSGIWLDWDNRHSRVCQNLIVGTRSMFGGIFIEASHTPNLLDNNIIVNTDGHGVYSHDSDRITVAHNLIARSSKAAVFLSLGDPKRWVKGRGATSRKHRVVNNIFAENETVIEFATPDNSAEGNYFGRNGEKGPLRIHRPEENLDLDAWREFHGWDLNGARADVTIEFDAETFELACSVGGAAPTCQALPEANIDFTGVTRPSATTVPGPFARLPRHRAMLTFK